MRSGLVRPWPPARRAPSSAASTTPSAVGHLPSLVRPGFIRPDLPGLVRPSFICPDLVRRGGVRSGVIRRDLRHGSSGPDSSAPTSSAVGDLAGLVRPGLVHASLLKRKRAMVGGGSKRLHGSGRFHRHLGIRSSSMIRPVKKIRGRRGSWWDREFNCIAIEGRDFAQDTQEGGADRFEFVPDSDDEIDGKSSSVLDGANQMHGHQLDLSISMSIAHVYSFLWTI